MRKRILIKALAIGLILSTGVTTLSGCTGGNSSGGTVNEKEANKQGYYKKNGKWYYQGDGAY